MSPRTIIEINHDHIDRIRTDPADFVDRLLASILKSHSDDKAKMLAKVQLEALGVRRLCDRRHTESIHVYVGEQCRYREATREKA